MLVTCTNQCSRSADGRGQIRGEIGPEMSWYAGRSSGSIVIVTSASRLIRTESSETGRCEPYSAALLTPLEVAEILRVTPRTVRQWARDGRIERVRLGGRLARYTAESVEALIHSHNDEPPPAITQTTLQETSGGRARHGED